jgi:hypothetical protein
MRINGELLFYAAAVIIEYEGTRWMDALSIESESQRAHDLTLLCSHHGCITNPRISSFKTVSSFFLYITEG